MCDAKIKLSDDMPFVQCDLESEKHSPHVGVLKDYAYPGSKTTIVWQESDRRNFRGKFTECDESTCLLPAGHNGDHVPRLEEWMF